MKLMLSKPAAWLIGLAGFVAIPASTLAQSQLHQGLIATAGAVGVGILGSHLSRAGSRLAGILCFLVAIIVGAAGVVQVVDVYRSSQPQEGAARIKGMNDDADNK
jgi:hypothetical protein